MHLRRDLQRLEREILAMGAFVQNAFATAVAALAERRPELAEQVEAGDGELDAREVALEEECLKILALHQPFATDLRFVVAILKVNNDVERMGDLAVNVAERARDVCARDPVDVPPELLANVARAQRMVEGCLDALVRLDAARAREVRAADREVDAANRALIAGLVERMRAEPAHLESLLALISISRHVERLADLATNIAEDVVFLVEGVVVRHRG